MFTKLKNNIDAKISIKSNGLLWNTTVFFVVSGFIFLLLMLVDHRQVLGINTWIKPSKFAFSLASYTMTLAFILPKLDITKKAISRLTNVTSWFLILEFLLITMQAGRGVRSHFNKEAVFDSIVYGLMGLSIVIALIPAIYITYYLFTRSKIVNKLYSKANQFGMIILLFGSSYAGKVSSGDGHSVGADDSTAGIPYLNWSTKFGDLRVAHFLAIHGIHVFLIVAWILNKCKIRYSKLLMYIFIALYFILCMGVLIMNELGNSSLWFLG